MKKLFVLLSMFLSLISFSFIDGKYTVTKNKGNTIAIMKMICKNNKILSVNFDELYTSGKSIKLENKSFARQSMTISNHVSMNNSIEGVKIDFSNQEYSDDFKELYKFLESKAKSGKIGDYTI